MRPPPHKRFKQFVVYAVDLVDFSRMSLQNINISTRQTFEIAIIATEQNAALTLASLFTIWLMGAWVLRSTTTRVCSSYLQRTQPTFASSCC